MNEPRKIIKLGKYTYAVTIPAESIKRYGWREKQKVMVEDKGRGHLVIRDWKKH